MKSINDIFFVLSKRSYQKFTQQYNEFNEIDTVFINSGSSKIYDPYILILNLLDKTSLNKSDKYVSLSNLNIYYTWERIKKSH